MKLGLFWFIVTIVLLSSCGEAMRINLGKGMDTTFVSGNIKTHKNLELTYVDFLNYKTFLYRVISFDNGEKLEHDKAVGRYSTTLQQNWACKIAFGTPSDTCSIVYFSTLKPKRSDLPTTVRETDIFSNSKIDPAVYINLGELSVNGVLRNGRDSALFFFKKTPESVDAVGSIDINGNTLFLLPVNNAVDRKGNAINKHMGMQLTQSGTMIAALNTSRKPNKIYISKNMTPAERLFIAAYLSLVISHQKFSSLTLYGY